MAAYGSTRGEHYIPRMKTRVTQVGQSTMCEQDGLVCVALAAAAGSVDDGKGCGIKFLGVV